MKFLKVVVLIGVLVSSCFAQEFAGMPMHHETAVAQDSSGTSWEPASSPEFMWMTSARSWMLMAHGELMAG